MTHWIQPSRLLHQADELGGRDAGRGRPSPTDLRRSVSSAYYALFHQICLAAADLLFAEEADRIKLTAVRWIDHRDVKYVCESVTRVASVPGTTSGLDTPRAQAPSVWRLLTSDQGGGSYGQAVPSELAKVSQVFPRLQDARHEADYDHLQRISKQQVLSHADDARSAVQAVVNGAADPYFRRFIALILARGSRL